MSKLHHAIYLTIIGALVIVILGLLTPQSIDYSYPPASHGVVVFDFVAMDSESEFTAAEMTTTLIQSLEKAANISVLTNADLPSSMQDSSNHHRWPKIELVSFVLEGSVKNSEEGASVTVQLIDVSSDAHIWSNTFVSEQVDVARIVAAVENQVILTARR
jgi:TolB-like protein